MQNRVFGRQLVNFNNQNHIILKSRSFSFENKSKNLHLASKDSGPFQQDPQKIARRCSFASVSTKTKKTTDQSKHALEKSQIIKDSEMSLQQKIQAYSKDPQINIQYIIDNLEMMTSNEEFNFQLKLNNKDKISLLSSKRAKIIDWLVAVHYQLKLFPVTLYLAVSYLDTYLAKCEISEKELEIIGLTCVLMAGKFQETYRIPRIKNLLTYTHSPITRQDMKQAQEKITTALDFQYIAETPVKYLDFYTKLVDMSQKNKHIALYILELSLLDSSFLDFKPSLLAASATYLVHKIRRISPFWPKYLEELTKLSENDLRSCAKQLCSFLEKSQGSQLGKKIKKKYSTSQFFEASKIRLQRKTE